MQPPLSHRATPFALRLSPRARAAIATTTFCALTLPALAQRSTPLQLLHPSGAASDRTGLSVAVDADTMIVSSHADDVGANVNQGSALVYRWTGAGWTLEATLTAPDGAPGDVFGQNVSLSGDTAVIGAPADDVGANADQGSAYVFVRTGSTWTQQAHLTAAAGAAGDNFGNAVAITANTIIVGAPNDDVGANANQGSARVFVRTGSIWSEQATLTASDGAASDAFGTSASLSGETAVIGAPTDDVGANANQGSAYVFTRTGATWGQQSQLTAADGAADDQFGFLVCISGDTAIAGAPFDDVGANAEQGSAYAFTRAGAAWSQQAQLVNTDGAPGDNFGVAGTLAGDTAIVGAYLDDVGAVADQGSASVFTRDGAVWTQSGFITAPDGAVNERFGRSAALHADTAVIGAWFDDVGAINEQGSAWVFSRINDQWIGPDLALLAADGAPNDLFGFSVAMSGETAIVGAQSDDVGANSNQGSAYVFVRGPSGWVQQAQLVASDGLAGDAFGIAVSLSGDTAIVGANQDDIGANSGQGSAYVFTRSAGVWSQQAKLVHPAGAAADLFGVSVDVENDTALVGAVADDVGANANQGSAHVFTRSGVTWTFQLTLTAADGVASDLFGQSVSLSGTSVIVGAYQDNGSVGSAYVFTGSGPTWTQQARLFDPSGAASDTFGYSVDIDGDTAIVGAQNDDVGSNGNQGSACVFIRSGSTWTLQAKLTSSDGAVSDAFGYSVATEGNTAVVGALSAGNQGAAYVFTRQGTIWTQRARLSDSFAPLSNLGNSVSLAGEYVLAGSPGDDVGANADQGSAFLFPVPFDSFPSAHNDALGLTYPTLALAFVPAQSGHQITATPAAWGSTGFLDTLGRSLGLYATGPIRTPSTSIITLGGSSTLVAPPGDAVDVFGQLRTATNSSADVYADAFSLGSRAIMTARTGSSLTINAVAADLDGQTRVEQGASLTFAGSASAIGPTTCSLNSSLTLGGSYTNIDTFTMTSGTINAPLFDNRAQANIFGSTAIFGSFSNAIGATTTIRSGTLFVFGSLTNNGTIIGTICAGCTGTPPNLDIGGSLTLGTAANLIMPFDGSHVRVGGSFDCAINSNARYDMSLATLQPEGAGAPQTLEVMSTDIGPDALGLDRNHPGHYPIANLEIGPSPSTVTLADSHDNDNLGQAACEAIYVDEVIIHAGSHLINPTCRIYYNTLTNNGTVDVPSNLIQIGGPVGCDSIDFNNDGLFPDTLDLDDFLSVFAGGACSNDPNCSDIDFNNDGLFPDTLDIDSLLSVFAGGPCL